MDRRTFLRLLGTGAGGVAGCSSRSRESATPEGTRSPTGTPGRARTQQLAERFDSVVDAVADAGCDPSGDAACAAAIERAVDDDTLLVFPSGTYRIEEEVSILEHDNVGVRGEGDVTFVAPPNFNGRWIRADRGRDLVFENVTLDVSASNSAPTLYLAVEDGLEVRDVEVVGRGTRAGSEPGDDGNVDVGSALLPIVRSPDGVGIVERFVAKTGGRIGTYNGGNGRIGVYVGRSTYGTVRLIQCHLEEFPNNGVYASRTNGRVEVIGGTYRNNDISQVRLGSEGSFLELADVEVDVADVGGPNAPDDFLHPRGVRIESGPLDTAGVTVRNVDVRMTNTTASGIDVGRAGGEFRIEDTHVRVDSDGPSAVLAKRPTGGSYDPPPEPHHGTISGLTVEGEAGGGPAIRVFGRPGTRIEDTTVSQANGDRDGVALVDSPATITDSTVTAGRYPIVLEPDGDRDDCLVSLENTRLTCEDAERGEVLALPSALAIEPFSTADSYCMEPSVVRQADVDGDPAVLVSETGFGGLYGRVTSVDAFDKTGYL